MRIVASEPAEVAQGLINIALAGLRIELACDDAHRRPEPRLVTRALPSHRSYLLQSALLRMVSVAEEFSRSSLTRVVQRELPTKNKMVSHLWDRAAGDVDLAWHRQLGAWNEWFGLNVEGATAYKALSPFVDARNAVVHGLGQLTRSQLKKDGGRGVKARLANAGLAMAGNDVVLDEPGVQGCAAAARAYVTWLDSATPGLRPR